MTGGPATDRLDELIHRAVSGVRVLALSSPAKPVPGVAVLAGQKR